MTERQTYLALESALLRIAPEEGEDPSGNFQRFLTRMDVRMNGLKYGIFESEDEEITLLWKKFVDSRGFKPQGFGYGFAQSFLDSLGRLSGKAPNSLYDEDVLRPTDSDWGIDPDLKAARIFSKRMSRSDYQSAAVRLLADQMKRELLWFLRRIQSESDPEGIEEEIAHIESISSGTISSRIRSELGDFSSDFDFILSLIREENPGTYTSRIGKAAFRLLSDSWFLFEDEVDRNNPVLLELNSNETPIYPSYTYIAVKLISGWGLRFRFEGHEYLAAYPLDRDVAMLIRGGTEIDRGSIDGFLTNPRFTDESRARRMSLLKTFRECSEKTAVPPEEARRLLEFSRSPL